LPILQIRHAKPLESLAPARGTALAVEVVMLTNLKKLSWVKALACAGLFVTMSGVLSGCYVETGRRYHRPYYARPVIVVR
jgi:hypothetical protein